MFTNVSELKQLLKTVSSLKNSKKFTDRVAINFA